MTLSDQRLNTWRTNMRLSTASCLVPATARTYLCTFVMEYPNFSLSDVYQNDVADCTGVSSEHPFR